MLQNIKKILVPMDFSRYSAQALKTAWELAEETSAELYLLHVVVPHHFFIPLPGDETSSREIAREASMLEQAEEELARIKRDELENSKKVNTSVVVGAPVAKIADFSKDNEIDLVVVCTHGRTGGDLFSIGSVAEKLARHAPCAVLVLRRE